MAPARSGAPAEGGLSALRRPGKVTELLLLYEITVHRHTRLRPIAQALGVSVQAASLLLRELSRRGLASTVEGTYRPTVKGIAHLHASLTVLREELEGRLGRLQVVRRTRALASGPIREGEPVALTLEGGLLRARAGDRGASRGRAVGPASDGELVEVEGLEGIVPLQPSTVRCLVLPSHARVSPGLSRRVARELRRFQQGLVAGEGLEAVHLLTRSTRGPVVRFGVAAAAREAAQMGVPVLVLVSEERLPTFLQRFSEPSLVAEVDVETLRAP
jgi:predicted transcriptional regulator